MLNLFCEVSIHTFSIAYLQLNSFLLDIRTSYKLGSGYTAYILHYVILFENNVDTSLQVLTILETKFTQKQVNQWLDSMHK